MSMVKDQVNGRGPSDANLEIAVREAIEASSGTRIWGHAFYIKVVAGVVELTGWVRTVTSKLAAEKTVRAVQGVVDVKNNLVVDTQLEVAVAQALGEDPRTRGSFPGILVGAAFGEVLLKGDVTPQDIKKAAGEIAGAVPGVRVVTNQLLAPEPPKPAAPAKPAAKPAPKLAPKPAEDETTIEE